jgi:hypothetical protein
MNTTNNNLFYARLPVNTILLSDLLTEEHLFYKIPSNWHIVVADIRNSTKAAMDGQHQTVNLVATGCIVAALNVASNNDILIPFFFGGDGATFIIPPELLQSTMMALQQHSENTLSNFNLDLRVGHMPVEEIYAANHELRISKLKISTHFDIPILLGEGLSFSEKKIKQTTETTALSITSNYELDMSGMQCRWDKIKPPANNFEVVSLLVIARDIKQQATAFKLVIQAIDEIYGNATIRTPISIDKLKLKSTFGKISTEMKTRLGHFNAAYLFKNIINTFLGKLYFKTKKGKEYLHSLVDSSDILVIDGRINTVITGSATQRENLENVLVALESKGLILYGIHVSYESVMSCYVKSMDNHHIHFIDGADGGYTKAALVLKQKMLVQKNT